jgi:hypothetical protein
VDIVHTFFLPPPSTFDLQANARLMGGWCFACLVCFGTAAELAIFFTPDNVASGNVTAESGSVVFHWVLLNGLVCLGMFKSELTGS